ncbi:response regulator [Psychrobacillus sp. NPDC058041]|uniref:response regulator n=1 Tax=Psychrobacillus sp. NPDC058041 TaxID=3346310 RepID=UPI0036DBE443
MWKIIIVEDEQPIVDLHTRLLEKDGLFQVIKYYTSPIEAAKELPNEEVDAIFLDIEMPKMTGIELAEGLVESGIDVPIIFSTAYSKYAVDAFRVQALDYILKPMTPKTVIQLDERLTKYYGKQKGDSNNLVAQLYGDVFVRHNETTVKWPTKVTEELFYYLLINENKVVNRYRIIDDIWPNQEEKRALANLYNSIYRMRQLFADLNVPIEINRMNEGYELKTNGAVKHILPNNHKDHFLESKGYLWAYTH